MKKKIMGIFSIALALGILLAGCGGNDVPSNEAEEPSNDTSISEEAGSSEGEHDHAPEEEKKDAPVLYIGTGNGNFNTYPADIEGEVTPDALVKAIGELTGWNLSLADEITTGKGGMTVSFAFDSALFVGPPEPQKEEFFVYDGESLTMMILESIHETLRNYYAGAEGTLDVYYSMEGDKPLEIPNTGMCFPMDEPYSWDKMYFK